MDSDNVPADGALSILANEMSVREPQFTQDQNMYDEPDIFNIKTDRRFERHSEDIFDDNDDDDNDNGGGVLPKKKQKDDLYSNVLASSQDELYALARKIYKYYPIYGSGEFVKRKDIADLKCPPLLDKFLKSNGVTNDNKYWRATMVHFTLVKKQDCEMASKTDFFKRKLPVNTGSIEDMCLFIYNLTCKIETTTTRFDIDMMYDAVEYFLKHSIEHINATKPHYGDLFQFECRITNPSIHMNDGQYVCYFTPVQEMSDLIDITSSYGKSIPTHEKIEAFKKAVAGQKKHKHDFRMSVIYHLLNLY